MFKNKRSGLPLGASENIKGNGVSISIYNDSRYVYVPTCKGVYAFEPARRQSRRARSFFIATTRCLLKKYR